MQNQKTVTDNFSTEQLLLFGIAVQHTGVRIRSRTRDIYEDARERCKSATIIGYNCKI